MAPITRKPELSEEQAAELAANGETTAVLRRAPWYYALIEGSWKYLLALVGMMGLFIGNGWVEALKENADANKGLAGVMSQVQQELVRQGAQLGAMTESMRQLSGRQDSAIATAERAMAEQQGLRSRVELLQYYVLEFDGKLIAAGLVKPSDAVALKLRKNEEKQ